MFVYKILIMEKHDIINIEVFSIDKDKNKIDIYHYWIAEDLKRIMLVYIKGNYYKYIYYLLRYFIIDNPTLQYPQDCLICISTKEYTFNFTLDDFKSKSDSLYGEFRNEDDTK